MTKCLSHQPKPTRICMRRGVAPVCLSQPSIPRNRRGEPAKDLCPGPDHLIESLRGYPFAPDAATDSHLEQPQPHALPIGAPPGPAASSLGVFSTRADRPSRDRRVTARIENPSPKRTANSLRGDSRFAPHIGRSNQLGRGLNADGLLSRH